MVDKDIYLDLIYDNLNLHDHAYQILDKLPVNDCNIIKEYAYVSANQQGETSLLIFAKNGKKNISARIDRTSLRFVRKSLDYENVRFVPLEFDIPDDFYKGTILDGMVVTKDMRQSFVITDVLFYAGEDMRSKNLMSKIKNVSSFFSPDTSKNINVIGNEIFEIKMTKTFVQKHLSRIARKYPIEGIAFFKEHGGIKLVFKNVKEDGTTKKQAPEKSATSSIKKVVVFKPIEQDKDVFTHMLVKRGEKSGIYELYFSYLHENKTKYKLAGFLYIPTLEQEHEVFNHFGKNDQAILDVKYNTKFEVWEYIKLNTTKTEPVQYKILKTKIGIVIEQMNS